jgi:hypothetical protein
MTAKEGETAMSWRPAPTCKFCHQSVGEAHWELFQHSTCQPPMPADSGPIVAEGHDVVEPAQFAEAQEHTGLAQRLLDRFGL